METMIKVWDFKNAPDDLKALSQHGGDEDWIAVVPKEVLKQHFGSIGWIESGSFGCCDVSEHEREDDVVFIGAHS